MQVYIIYIRLCFFPYVFGALPDTGASANKRAFLVQAVYDIGCEFPYFNRAVQFWYLQLGVCRGRSFIIVR